MPTEACSPVWYDTEVLRWTFVYDTTLTLKYEKWPNRNFTNCRKFPRLLRRTLGCFDTGHSVAGHVVELSGWAKASDGEKQALHASGCTLSCGLATGPTHTLLKGFTRATAVPKNECKQCFWCASIQSIHSGPACDLKATRFLKSHFRVCVCVCVCVYVYVCGWDTSG